jgi:bifunctional UDP-N-acetylglucosamine pyrophosphorylase / glucosamine-1-phosphate N-acetyltransferase
MQPTIEIEDYVAGAGASPLAKFVALLPWTLVTQVELVVRELLGSIQADEFFISGDIAVHRTSTVESGAILKGPLVLGPNCFVAAGAYLRGGNWIDANCILGPGAELKSSFVFAGTKLAHFNFVGDSILGEGVNLEAGSIICNYRNERQDKEIHVRVGNALCATGVEKFGALVGSNSRLGANAVIAPGALLQPGTVIRRAELFDQETTEAIER